MSRQHVRNVMGLAIVAALGGCAVGPHLASPQSTAPQHYTRTDVPAQIGHGELAQNIQWSNQAEQAWWTLFRSPQLDQLIAKSFQQNPNLSAAQDALEAAQEYTRAQIGAESVQVGANVGVQRSTAIRSVTGQGRVLVPGKPFTLSYGTVSVAYNPDVFGLERDLVKNAKAREMVSKANVEQAKVFLAGAVAQASIAAAGSQAELKLARDITQDEQNILDLLHGEYQLGAANEQTVEEQQAVVQTAQSQIPLLIAQRDLAQHALAYLVGENPDAPLPALQLSDFQLPPTIPALIPSALVKNRPDIQASLAAVDAAAANVGVATARMYPNINIGGNLGLGSGTAWFSPASAIWSMASSIAAPLYNGGTLTAEKRAAMATWKQSTAQYRSTVLGAFRQVADSLRVLQTDADSYEHRQMAADAASQAFRIAQARYQAGAIDYQTLLNAELQYQRDQVAALQARVRRYQDSVSLFVAMGDGWWQKS